MLIWTIDEKGEWVPIELEGEVWPIVFQSLSRQNA